MARKPTDTVQLKLRFPEHLRRRVAREARQRKVSLNTAIISLLEEALAAWPPGAVDPNAVAARVLLNSLDDAVVAKLIEIVQKDWAAMDYDESDERPGKEGKKS